MLNFKGMRFPIDVTTVCIRWYPARPRSYRHLEEMMEERGVSVDDSSIKRWAIRFLPLIEKMARKYKRPVRGSDLRGIGQARAISVATVRNMRQNLGFAFAYNAVGIPLAAGVLYLFTSQLLSPMAAALAMRLSSVSVIANAMRLRGMQAPVKRQDRAAPGQ